MNTVRQILHKYDVPAENIADFIKEMREITGDEDFTIAASLDFEKLLIYDELQRCYVDGPFGFDHLYHKRLAVLMCGFDQPSRKESRLRNIKAAAIALSSFTTKERTKFAADNFYDFWAKAAAQEPYKNKDTDLEAQSRNLIADYRLLDVLAPAMKKIITLSYRNKADVESTMTICAIELFRQKEKRLPNNLDELVSAKLLTDLPIDPYSGKPFVYKKTEDNYTLYSAADNFKDEGGKRPEKLSSGRHSIWPGDGQDGDAVFWPAE